MHYGLTEASRSTFIEFHQFKFFTNYDVESVVDDFDEIYMLVNNTDIIDEIKKNVKEEIIDDLQKNVDALFGYSDNTILDSVQKILNNVTKMTTEIGSDAFIEFINKFSDFSKEFKKSIFCHRNLYTIICFAIPVNRLCKKDFFRRQDVSSDFNIHSLIIHYNSPYNHQKIFYAPPIIYTFLV